MSVWQTIWLGDFVSRTVALLLLAMSVASWVVILWKAWSLMGGASRVQRACQAFWKAADLGAAEHQLSQSRDGAWVVPLVQAVRSLEQLGQGTIAAGAERSTQLTRVLRDSLHQVLRQLQYGQVLLATVGSTAPFVGLLGTVWGIYHALTEIGAEGAFRIEQVSGPVGEALVMTAAGLAVAIPAVLAYNIFGRQIARIEADLEGFAFDLRELMGGASAASQS